MKPFLLALLILAPSQTRQWDYHRVNELRSEHGVASLKTNSILQHRAQEYAEILARRGLLTDDPSDKACIRAGGTRSVSNTGFGPSVRIIQHYLEKSKDHMHNTLNKHYTMIGIGFAYGKGNDWWLVQEYCG